MDKTTHKCRAGFYCESGSKTPDPVTCPVGHMCPEGQGQVCLGVGGVPCFFGEDCDLSFLSGQSL